MPTSTQKVPDTARFAVVVCPRCKHAKGVDRASKTTACGRCHARHELADLRLLYVTGSAETLQAAVGIVEARVAGGDEAVVDIEVLREEIEHRHGPPRDAPGSTATRGDRITFAASLAAGIESMPRKADRILDGLNVAFPDGFGLEDVEDAFEQAGIPRRRAETEIRRGLVQDTLFEPRPGKLQRLG